MPNTIIDIKTWTSSFYPWALHWSSGPVYIIDAIKNPSHTAETVVVNVSLIINPLFKLLIVRFCSCYSSWRKRLAFLFWFCVRSSLLALKISWGGYDRLCTDNYNSGLKILEIILKAKSVFELLFTLII